MPSFFPDSSLNLTSITYPQTWISSGTSAIPYYYPQPNYLPSVAEAPKELGDREWLDAQVAEVCELAVAA